MCYKYFGFPGGTGHFSQLFFKQRTQSLAYSMEWLHEIKVILASGLFSTVVPLPTGSADPYT